MKDVDALVPAFAAHFDETLRRTLKPRRHHSAVLVPDIAEALPVARIAPHDPVLHDLANAQLVDEYRVHPNHRLLAAGSLRPARLRNRHVDTARVAGFSASGVASPALVRGGPCSARAAASLVIGREHASVASRRPRRLAWVASPLRGAPASRSRRRLLGHWARTRICCESAAASTRRGRIPASRGPCFPLAPPPPCSLGANTHLLRVGGRVHSPGSHPRFAGPLLPARPPASLLIGREHASVASRRPRPLAGVASPLRGAPASRSPPRLLAHW